MCEFSFRLGVRTLAEVPGATLLDLPQLFLDARARRRAVGYLQDPLIVGQWQALEQLSEGERTQHLQAPLSRIMSLITTPSSKWPRNNPGPWTASGERTTVTSESSTVGREHPVPGDGKLHEYVDLAKTAKTRNRPRFMEMVADIEREQNVDYVIVHKLNRFARNAMDDAVIDYRLNQAGAQLASVLEHIDATPAGKLNHRIHAAFSEYENENLANEIRKGQIQKHRAGGTPFTAPVGYKHAQVEYQGRLINSIILDEERAPLVQLGFELYDTGQYSITRLRDTLEEMGLTCRPTRTRVAKPLSRNGVHTTLRNPYYVGIVVYMGQKARGRHPKVIDQALFDRVQARLDAQRAAGERPKRHMHYLKGTLTCDKCGSRMIFGRHRGKTGTVYDYFSCVNRRARNGGTCDSGRYRAEQIEVEVAALYLPLKLTRGQVAKIRREVTAIAEKHTTAIQRAAVRHRRRLKQLEEEQTSLLELHYKQAVSESVMQRQTERIETEEKTLNQLLARSEVQLADVRESLDDALALIERPPGDLPGRRRSWPQAAQPSLLQRDSRGRARRRPRGHHRSRLRPHHRPTPHPSPLPRSRNRPQPRPTTVKPRPFCFRTGV
jgi:site-specific DNA recombinase